MFDFDLKNDDSRGWTTQDPGAGGPGHRGLRKGFGALFIQDGDQNWFHFSVQRPMYPIGADLVLYRLFLLFNTFHAQIDKVSLYDGGKFVQSFPVDWKGDHGDSIDSSNTLSFGGAFIFQQGIGVSAHVVFDSSDIQSGGTNQYGGGILFTTVGATFFEGLDKFPDLTEVERRMITEATLDALRKQLGLL